jgi:hypothetical protein
MEIFSLRLCNLRFQYDAHAVRTQTESTRRNGLDYRLQPETLAAPEKMIDRAHKSRVSTFWKNQLQKWTRIFGSINAKGTEIEDGYGSKSTNSDLIGFYLLLFQDYLLLFQELKYLVNTDVLRVAAYSNAYWLN